MSKKVLVLPSESWIFCFMKNERKIRKIEIPNDATFSPESHSFNVSLAKYIGLEESILLQNFYVWHKCNKENEDMVRDGKVWFFRSVSLISEDYPYLTQNKVRGVIDRFIESGFLVKGDYNEGGLKKANWYALTDKALKLMSGNAGSKKSSVRENHEPFVESTNHSLNSQLNYNNKDIEEEHKREDIYKRQQAFVNEIGLRFSTIYPADMLNKFIDYWTEPNKSNTKMRFEMEKTWDLAKRLKRWSDNNLKFRNNGQANYNSGNDKQQRAINNANTLFGMLQEVERNRRDGKFGRGTDNKELCW